MEFLYIYAYGWLQDTEDYYLYEKRHIYRIQPSKLVTPLKMLRLGAYIRARSTTFEDGCKGANAIGNCRLATNRTERRRDHACMHGVHWCSVSGRKSSNESVCTLIVLVYVAIYKERYLSPVSQGCQ